MTVGIEVTPTRLHAGRRETLTVRLINSTGRDLTNVVFKVTVPRPFLLLRGDGRVDADRLQAGQSVAGRIEVEPRAVGTFVLTSSNFSYRDDLGRHCRPEDVRIEVEVLPPAAPDRSSRATPGRESRDSRTPAFVFLSYAHEDARYVEKLKEAMAGMRREGLIRVWHDREILPGAMWVDEIDEAIDQADIFVPLVSASFLNSDYCMGPEWRRAQERREVGGLTIMPIIARYSDWKSFLGGYQVLPDGGRPISDFSDQDKAYYEIVSRFRRRLRHAGSGGRARGDGT